jgi:hypothetical protein
MFYMSHEHPNEYPTSDPTSHSWMLNNRQELHKYDESIRLAERKNHPKVHGIFGPWFPSPSDCVETHDVFSFLCYGKSS